MALLHRMVAIFILEHYSDSKMKYFSSETRFLMFLIEPLYHFNVISHFVFLLYRDI